MRTIMQGDSYKVPVKLTVNNEVLDTSKIEDVEVYLGNLRKSLKENTIVYDEQNQKYLVMLEQEDTFKLSGILQIIVRVKFNGGNVVGKNAGAAKVTATPSREVL